MPINISAYKKPPLSITASAVSTTASSVPRPVQKPDPDYNSPVDAINTTPASRSGMTTTSTSTIVGQPVDQSGAIDRKAAFTAANSTDSAGAAQLSAAEKQANLDAVTARKSGVLGCIGKGPTAAPCSGACDTVNCLTNLLTGNLLDVDAKKLMCDAISSTERSLKRQIDSSGDQLLAAAQTATSLAPLVAPLSSLQSAVNKMDPGAVANCFGAQALKDKINGQFNKAKNTINKFQKGYQDKIAKGFNKATEAAQQFSVTPNLCGDKSPASLRSLIG